ncbi:hypothetical protein ACFVQ0_37000 [Streptomyces sp. NPDC057900]|uniref:hypothetical protein n=1 Tax=Streptomyces sp. NPDC057900 TaxID=3346274 RepID=UPI0036DFF932
MKTTTTRIITESFVPGVYPRQLVAQYRVEGDNPFRAYATRTEAETRAAELDERDAR